MSRVFRVLLFSLLCTCWVAGSIVYLRVHRSTIEARLQARPQTATERIRKLRAQFEAAGCISNNLYEEAVPTQDLPNLICTIPGAEPGTIVVGAPVDYIADGSGPETQWATLALLPLLAESVGSVQHRHSLTFVAFTGQQHGLRGSSEYLKELTQWQHLEIRAMVSLDDIGRTPVVYALAQDDLLLANWLTLSSSTLRLHSMPMEITARSVDAPLVNGKPMVNRGGFPSSSPHSFSLDEYLLDAKAFQRAHIPAIALRSAPISMIPAMRKAGAWTETSSGKSFDSNIYEETYNLLSVYLLYLDSNLGTAHPSAPTTEVAATATPANPATPKDSQDASSVLGATSSAAGKTDIAIASAAVPPSVSTSSSQPGPTEVPPDVPVFHAETKLVIMDVSVTDSHGAPVKGLQAGDFTLLENGKPQAIRVFETHGSSQAPQGAAAANSLPPGTFSNRVSSATDTPLNILFFDMLNTPPQDQAYAREQMLQYLRGMPTGKYLALFVLGTHLQMVQGFTDDRDVLVKTAEKLIRQTSPLLTTELQQQQDQGFTEEVGRHAQPSMPNVPASVASSVAAARTDAQSSVGFVSQRTATAARTESIRSDQRTTMTLDALSAVARAVSGFPGRKNLVWLSGSFQIRLRPSDNTVLGVAARTSQAASAVSDLSSTFSYQESIRRLTTVMAAARIAVYPIDVRGLRTGGVAIGVGAESSRSMVDPGNNDAYNNALGSQSESRFGEHSSMLDLAQQTGGHVFLDNDVRGSIARSIEDGSTYYTLAYTPEKNSDDKSFRRVDIKMNRGSALLAYRPGYYPTQSQDSLKQSGAHMLAAAMQPGLPQSTMLLVTLRVSPPNAVSQAVRVDYSIDLSGIDFNETADNRKRAILDCMAVALDGNANIAGQVANTMDATLGPQEFLSFQHTGLPAHQELVLPPGKYDLRVGVLDRASQRIGTVNVPLVISAETKVN